MLEDEGLRAWVAKARADDVAEPTRQIEGPLTVDVLMIGALLFGVFIKATDFGNSHFAARDVRSIILVRCLWCYTVAMSGPLQFTTADGKILQDLPCTIQIIPKVLAHFWPCRILTSTI